MFLLMGRNYVSDGKIGRECHGLRKNYELNINKANMNDPKRKIYKNFAELAIGREIILVAMKK